MTSKTKAPAPTPAAEWRKPREEGYIVTLPSGLQPRLRPVALDVLIMAGEIPDLLSPIAAKMLWSETNVEQIADVAELATGTAKLMNIVCKAAFLYPRIVDEDPGDDEITLEDVSFADKSIVFQLAIQPAEVLRKFRDEQAAGMVTVPDGQDDGAKTK